MSADAMDSDESLITKSDRAVEFFRNRLPVMVLTGAGISVESQVPPFRGPGGLWERYDPYEYGHIDTFRSNPERTWVMLREIIEGAICSKPNDAHLALARMEERGWIRPLVTQNVDGLHRMAGSKDLLEVHGNARRIYCPECGKEEMIDGATWSSFRMRCNCGSIKRPDIVFFGEGLPEMAISRAFDLAYQGADMIVVGTSGVVQPVASLPPIARSNGGRIVEVNSGSLELTGRYSDILIQAEATRGMTALESAFERAGL
ncbi:MAG: SIR2 family NAD-dependent protein deacylase [Thermoplasmatota archaeon]